MVWGRDVPPQARFASYRVKWDEEYRERWGLPGNYPMVAPNYAKQRRALAKKIGLGTSQKGKRKSKR